MSSLAIRHKPTDLAKYTLQTVSFIKGKEKPQAVTWGRLQRCLHLTPRVRRKQVDFSNHPLRDTVQYSNSSQNIKNNSNSTVTPKEVLINISDLVHEGYEPYYIKCLRQLGTTRFMELANKARAGSDDPQKLFAWMLKNNPIVK